MQIATGRPSRPEPSGSYSSWRSLLSSGKDSIRRTHGKTADLSAIVRLGEHDLVGRGVQSREQLLRQRRLDPPGALGIHQIANDRLDPGVVADAEDDDWLLLDSQAIDRSLREKIPIDPDLLHHLGAELLFDDLPHDAFDELEIA